jgi:hypothetical protein
VSAAAARAAAARAAAALALAALLAAGSGAARAPAVVGGAAPVGIIPDGMPYDSTRGDSVGEAALYLAWGVPHGSPGARQNINVSCNDTTRMDTLYLSIETGRDLPRFFGMYGRLAIRPAAGDSLGGFWSIGKDGPNAGGLPIQMDPDDTFPCARPWIHPGIGGAVYEFSPAAGDLAVIYAVTAEDAAPVSGRTRYCFARLLFKHRRCDLDGARQPVCIEWREGGYSGGGPDLVVRKGQDRFVTVNSPDGAVCVPYRRPGAPAAWRPPVPLRAVPQPLHRAVAADSTRR